MKKTALLIFTIYLLLATSVFSGCRRVGDPGDTSVPISSTDRKTTTAKAQNKQAITDTDVIDETIENVNEEYEANNVSDAELTDLYAGEEWVLISKLTLLDKRTHSQGVLESVEYHYDSSGKCDRKITQTQFPSGNTDFLIQNYEYDESGHAIVEERQIFWDNSIETESKLKFSYSGDTITGFAIIYDDYDDAYNEVWNYQKTEDDISYFTLDGTTIAFTIDNMSIPSLIMQAGDWSELRYEYDSNDNATLFFTRNGDYNYQSENQFDYSYSRNGMILYAEESSQQLNSDGEMSSEWYIEEYIYVPWSVYTDTYSNINLTPVEITEESFPDNVFRGYVVENFDLDKDLILSETELLMARQIMIDFQTSYTSMASATGIEKLPYLQSVVISSTGISDLDLSQNYYLSLIDCHDNYLRSLMLPNNMIVRSVDCILNELTSIDVSRYPYLTKLDVSANKLNSLDVSKNLELKELRATENYYTELDCSGLTMLESLDVSQPDTGRAAIMTLNLDGCSSLVTLWCDNNYIRELNLSDCTLLKNLNCRNNDLAILDISHCPNLTDYQCDDFVSVIR